MTDKDFDLKRLDIIKSFLETGEMLDLDSELSISIDSTTPGIYHVFTNKNNGLKKFEYSITDLKLLEIVNSLKLDSIKRIFVNDRLYKLRNKWIGKNRFNPMDFENCK